MLNIKHMDHMEILRLDIGLFGADLHILGDHVGFVPLNMVFVNGYIWVWSSHTQQRIYLGVVNG